MPIYRINVEGSNEPPPSGNALLEQQYNALDCALTHEVFGVLEKQLDEVTLKVYALEKSLQAPVFSMELRGVLVDKPSRDDMIFELSQDVSLLETSLQEILTEGIGVRIENPLSPKQLSYLLYDILGLPPQRSYKTGGTTVDSKALEKLKQYFYAAPIISHIQTIRDLSKQISTLRTSIDSDNRIRTSFNIAGTETGRFSSYASALGSGCVLPDAEALTRTGWKKISEVREGEEIAQWDNHIISFVPCTIFKKSFSGKLLKCSSEQLRLTVTPEHRVLHYPNYKTCNTYVKPASYVSTLSGCMLPLGGNLSGGTLEYPAFLSMLMADFSKEGNAWRGSFYKDRKQERVIQLSKDFGFDCVEGNTNKPGYRRFRIPGYQEFPKKWGSWVLELTQESAKALLEEARHWDSHDRGSGFIFSTVEKEQAEWFATLAHICGKSATIRSAISTEKSYKAGVEMWSVNVKNRAHANIMKKHWSHMSYEGDVFCPQVPSTFWLVREKDFISVTGNTNLQNLDPRVRKVFISDPGMKLAYIDLEQAESRAVGAIEWNLFQDPTYMDACSSSDLHVSVCKMCWQDLPWIGEPKADKNIAKEIFFRNFSYRDTSKRLGHLSNYGGKPDHAAKELRIEVRLVHDFQYRYFKAFPAHKEWHAWVRSKLLKDGFITTFMGRRRQFFGRRWEEDTVKEAIAYEPQSAVADYLNQGMLTVYQSGLCQLILQVHDAILVQYPEEQENEIVPKLQKMLEHEVPLMNGRSLTIPTDAKVGWNWGEFDKDKNPNGLVSFTGNDTRKRVDTKDIFSRKFSLV